VPLVLHPLVTDTDHSTVTHDVHSVIQDVLVETLLPPLPLPLLLLLLRLRLRLLDLDLGLWAWEDHSDSVLLDLMDPTLTLITCKVDSHLLSDLLLIFLEVLKDRHRLLLQRRPLQRRRLRMRGKCKNSWLVFLV
jgi:hypothetical protein